VNVGRKRAQEGQPKNLKGLGAFRFDFYYKSLFFFAVLHSHTHPELLDSVLQHRDGDYRFDSSVHIPHHISVLIQIAAEVFTLTILLATMRASVEEGLDGLLAILQLLHHSLVSSILHHKERLLGVDLLCLLHSVLGCFGLAWLLQIRFLDFSNPFFRAENGLWSVKTLGDILKQDA
jgi:hypothetical protein